MYGLAVPIAVSFRPRCIENRAEFVAEGAHHVDLEATEVALDVCSSFYHEFGYVEFSAND